MCSISKTLLWMWFYGTYSQQALANQKHSNEIGSQFSMTQLRIMQHNTPSLDALDLS